MDWQGVYFEGYWNGEPFARVGPVEVEVSGNETRFLTSLEVPPGSGPLSAALVDADGRKLCEFKAHAAPGDHISPPTLTVAPR